jgi:hypothetical protein
MEGVEEAEEVTVEEDAIMMGTGNKEQEKGR